MLEGQAVRRNAHRLQSSMYEAEYTTVCDAGKTAIFEEVVLSFRQPQLAGMCVYMFGANRVYGDLEQSKQGVEELAH